MMSNMKTANVNVRIETEIKERAEKILETLGISRATAINMFYRQIILNNGIPFRLNVPGVLPARDDLSDAAFDAMMQKGYLEARTGNSDDIEEVFDELQSGLS